MTTGIFFWVEPAVCGGVMMVQNRSAFNFIIELESRIVIFYVFFSSSHFPFFQIFFFFGGYSFFYLTNSNLPKATGTESRANLFKEDESEKC